MILFFLVLPAFSHYCTSESPRKKPPMVHVRVKSVNQLLN